MCGGSVCEEVCVEGLCEEELCVEECVRGGSVLCGDSKCVEGVLCV